MTTKKKRKPEASKNHVPSLAAVLGIEPAVQFELLGGTFEARPLSISENLRLGAAGERESDSERLTAQADLLAQFLQARQVDGDEVTYEQLLDGIDVASSIRLFQLLQGQRRARAVDDEGDGGK